MNASRHPGGTLRLRLRKQAPAPSAAPVLLDLAEVAARKAANVQREREAHEVAVIGDHDEVWGAHDRTGGWR